MFECRRTVVPLLGLSAILLAGCLGKPVTVEVVERKVPAAIENRDALAAVELDRVIVKLRRGTVIGSFIYNPLVCIPQDGNVFWNQGRVLLRDLAFQDVFFEEMDAANYKVVGDPEEMFGGETRNRIKAEYLVGAQLEDIRLNLCEHRIFPTRRTTGTETGESSVRVTWQVFSRFDKKVVYETESKGAAKLTEPVPGGAIALIQDAFADAVANLAADENLVDLLRRKPRTVVDVRKVDEVELVLPPIPLSEEPISENIDLIRHSVVTIDTGSGHGSGFFISPTVIMTNHHVVEGVDLVRIILDTGRKILGEVIRKHPERDVALIQVQAAGHRPLPIRLEPVEITEEVLAIGAPLDKSASGTVTKGIVSRFRTNRYGLEDIQADVDIQSGNSGGALLDTKGNIVGITYAGVGEYSVGMNYSIPIYDALEKLNVSIDRKRGRVVAD